MQLYRLILPVIGAVVASLLAISAITIFLTNRLDDNSRASEERLVADMIAKLPERLETTAEDNSWWDEAVEKVHLEEDLEWINSIYGGTAEGQAFIDGTILLRADYSVLYQRNTANTPPQLMAFLQNGLKDTIDSLVPLDRDVGISASGFVVSGARVYAVGISMIQPAGARQYDPPLGSVRRPVVVFYQELSSDVIDSIGEDLNLSSLTISNIIHGRSQLQGKAAALISGLNDLVVAQLNWNPSHPGADLQDAMAWPTLFLLVIVFASLWVFILRARSLINELEKADRTKMAFLASMSHEVRTPLNAIIGFAEIVRLELHGEVKGEKNKEYLDIIRSSGEHLLTVINDILNISKLDAGKMEVFAEAMDPVEVIEESVRMVQNSANDRSIRLVKELESSMIISDERIIRQILVNLLSNAIKFTPAGGQVAVRSEIIEAGYKIVVADTGIGMSKEEIDQALEPFGQVHKGKNNVGGTGLGLPLVNRFLDLLGGSMTIRSAPAHGTSITVELPEAAPMSKEAPSPEDQLI